MPAQLDAPVRFSINIPNFGDFADPRVVARLAEAVEQTGWDGLFVWDHVVHRSHPGPYGDPWMLLAAAALATSRIRLGTLVTPVARRRPQQLARQVATLDNLSNGRVIFSSGLGGPIEDEYGSFGDTTDAIALASRLDEGLDLLERFWTGSPVEHSGANFTVHDVQLLPRPAQRPRPPIWIAGFWPRRPPMRRAMRYDGAVPLFESAPHGVIPDVDEVDDVVTYLRRGRTGEGAFDVVLGGLTPHDPATAATLIAPLVEAGATWWDERQLGSGGDVDRLTAVLRRVEAGPPAL
jgi:alkanesulfonate monooxygenase SsuD/methylene tetrahydromethanopterin reductase-like flavin-dependent oxidoreductase (luciferase family)